MTSGVMIVFEVLGVLIAARASIILLKWLAVLFDMLEPKRFGMRRKTK